jgi:15-cis-phytoene synthase
VAGLAIGSRASGPGIAALGDGTRLLRGEQRAALAAISTFACRIHEISGGPLEPAQKLGLLEAQATVLAGSGSAEDDPTLAALRVARERFDLPLHRFGELIAGARLEVSSDGYETFEQLLLYCRLGAGALGRICVQVLGGSDPVRAGELAESLAVAVKLTSILCALRSDAERGRVYLPAEDFRRYRLLGERESLMSPAELTALARAASKQHTVALTGLDASDPAQLYALMRFQVLRAHNWLHKTVELPALLDRRAGACLLALSTGHSRLLDRIAARPDITLAGRTALSLRERAWIAVRAVAGRGPRELHPAERLS